MKIIDTTLSLSPGGTRLVVAERDGVRLYETARPGAPGIRLDVPSWEAVAAFEDEAWVVTAGGTLHRFGSNGARHATPVLLGLQSVQCRLVTAPCEAPTAALVGPTPLALTRDCGELVVQRLEPPPRLVAPLGPREWLLARGDQLGVLRGGGFEPLEAAPPLRGLEIVDASAIAPGAVALLVREAAADSLWVIDTRTGDLRRKIQLVGATLVRFASRRSQAFVVFGERSLVVLDLRFGRPVHEIELAPVRDLAVDASGALVALALERDDGSTQIGWLTTQELCDGPAPTPPTTPAAADPDDGLPEAEAEVDQAAPPPAVPAPSVIVEPARSQPELPILELLALSPRKTHGVATGPAALRHLERQLALVGAWGKRAVAEGWDSGRLAFPKPGALPFEHEVAALVDGIHGRASDHLGPAHEQALALERQHDAALAGTPPLGDDGGHDLAPLAALAAEFGLSRVASDILLVVAAPSIWGELARLYAIVANDRERPLCDEWLVTVLLGSERAGRREIAAELEPSAPLVRHGLIQLGPGGRPFAPLGVHPLVTRILYGEDFSGNDADPDLVPRDPERPLVELLLPIDLGALLRTLARPPATPARLVVRGGHGCGRGALLAGLAAAAGRRLGVIDVAALARGARPLEDALEGALRRAVLRGWLPCVSGADYLPPEDAGLRDRIREVLRCHPGPITFRVGRDGTVPLDPGHLTCDLPALSEAERATSWRRSLASRGLVSEDADALAARFHVGPGVVERVVAAADLTTGRPLGTVLEDGLRQHRDARMSAVATRVTRLASWSNVILPADVVDSVREFIGRIRHRRTVFDHWGFDEVMASSRGLTALFQGGPGTGKSMVASLIARELGCDLYRVDLSRVMSKWIGETERNLAQVFDAAEDGQAIVLFDEADSLFARRTEVKSSNDRFANLEVNYLLQRLDSFEGIAILTTNLGGSIDGAFKRRLSLRLTFPFPDEEMREQLWRVHLPPQLPVEDDLDFGGLSRKYQLSGGYIRNVTLRAAFLAAHEGGRLRQDHLERAVGLEYREMGKLVSGGILE